MRIAIASDVHTELHADGGASFFQTMPEADVAVLAGDIGDSRSIARALGHALERYEHVVFVCGNHEYWWSSLIDMRARIEHLKRVCAQMSLRIGRLHVLENAVTHIGGQRFVGTTMWVPHQPGIERLEKLMWWDFARIADLRENIYTVNARAVEFLRGTVQSGDIVVTHHLPSWKSSDPQFEGAPSNVFYVCDVEDLIVERQPKLWIHGHTHASCDYQIGATRVLCNPFGLVGKGLNPSFDEHLVVEIDEEESEA